MRQTRLDLGGMQSVHAVRAAFTALASVEGIERADVTLGHARIEHDGSVTLGQLEAALALVGVQVLKITEERRGLPLL